jgi:molybdopterin-guanine dinucleotide biosynthesis protein A
LIGLAETVGYVSVEWPDDPFFNVNSPEDLAKAETRLA